MTQYGFYFDQTLCIGCRTCQIACKDKNRLDAGVLYRRVRSFEVGAYPHPGIYHLAVTCCHCAHPACARQCPAGRLRKDEETGLVYAEESIPCLGEACCLCVKACPYHHPVYDPGRKTTGKCSGCIDLVRRGEDPACVASCMMRALRFGPLEKLDTEYGPGTVTQLPCYPDGGTGPSVRIRAHKRAWEPDPEEKPE